MPRDDANKRPVHDRLRRPTLCLVTDRRRLVDAIGCGLDRWREALLAQATGAIRGGVDVLHIRERDLGGRDLGAIVRELVDRTRGTSACVVVNDRADVAIVAGADGVHLPEAGLPVAAVRRLMDTALLVGRSVHGVAGAEAGAAADYLIAGNVFETASKPGAAAPFDLSGFAALVRAADPVPVWAIGGVTEERIPSLMAHGAAGIAAIGAFVPSGPIQSVAAEVETLTTRLRAALDTMGLV